MSQHPALPEVRSADARQAEKLQTHERRLDRLERKLAKIKDGQIQGVHIQDGAIETDHITAGSITADGLAANSIMAWHIMAGAIQAIHIQAGAISTDQLAANSVRAGQILAGSINTDHISAGAVEAGNIAAGAIQAGHITAGSIGADHIQVGSVQAEHILAGSIQTEHLQSGSIVSDKIAARQITADHLAATVTLSSMLRTAASGSRIEIDNAGLRGYKAGTPDIEMMRFENATGNLTLQGSLTAQTGSAIPVTYVTSGNIVSGTIITIDTGGYLRTGPDENNAVKLSSAGLTAKSGGSTTIDINNTTSSFTGALFQTTTPGGANRVMLGKETNGSFTGFRAFASDGTTERVRIEAGSATFTGATFQTASSGARTEMSASNHIRILDSGGTSVVSLSPTGGLTLPTSSLVAGEIPKTASWHYNGNFRAGIFSYGPALTSLPTLSFVVSNTDQYGSTYTKSMRLDGLDGLIVDSNIWGAQVSGTAAVRTNEWFRSTNSGYGWYNNSRSVGIFAIDSSWIRSYNAAGWLVQHTNGAGDYSYAFANRTGGASGGGEVGAYSPSPQASTFMLGNSGSILPGYGGQTYPTIRLDTYPNIHWAINGTYCYYMATTGGLISTSARDQKTDNVRVDSTDFLDRLRTLPVYSYRFRPPGTVAHMPGFDRKQHRYFEEEYAHRHIGVMAEDFYAAFPELQDQIAPQHRHMLSTHNVASVALAGVRAEVAERESAVASIREDLDAIADEALPLLADSHVLLFERLDKLEKRLKTLGA